MTSQEILDAIAGDPALQALRDQGDFEGIARALTPLQQKVVVSGQIITTRGGAAKFPDISPLPGPLAFEAAMLALETFASTYETDLDPAHVQQRLFALAVRRQCESFQALGLDFGDPVLRSMLDSLVQAGVLTQAQADGFKSLVLHDAPPVTWQAVLAAVRGT